MGTLVIIGFGAILFVTVVLFPHISGKVKRKTDKNASRLKQIANWFWDPITWVFQGSVEFVRKALVTITNWARKTRRKLPF